MLCYRNRCFPTEEICNCSYITNCSHRSTEYESAHLCLFCTCWMKVSVKHFLHNIKEQTSNNHEEYGKPHWSTWQELNKYKVHILGAQKWPAKKDSRLIKSKYWLCIVSHASILNTCKSRQNPGFEAYTQGDVVLETNKWNKNLTS